MCNHYLLTVVLGCMLLPTAAEAQAAGSRDVARPTDVAEPTTFELHYDHATLLVADLDRSAAFIADVLHLEPLETPWGPTAPIRFFSLGGGRQLHVGITQRAIEPDRNAHLAFAVQNFDAYLQFLTERGIPYGNFAGTSSEPQVRPDGVRQIYLQDPDGNWIEVNDAAHPAR